MYTSGSVQARVNPPRTESSNLFSFMPCFMPCRGTQHLRPRRTLLLFGLRTVIPAGQRPLDGASIASVPSFSNAGQTGLPRTSTIRRFTSVAKHLQPYVSRATSNSLCKVSCREGNSRDQSRLRWRKYENKGSIRAGGDELVLPSICYDSPKRLLRCNHMHDCGSVAATQRNVHPRTGAAWKPPV